MEKDLIDTKPIKTCRLDTTRNFNLNKKRIVLVAQVIEVLVLPHHTQHRAHVRRYRFSEHCSSSTRVATMTRVFGHNTIVMQFNNIDLRRDVI